MLSLLLFYGLNPGGGGPKPGGLACGGIIGGRGGKGIGLYLTGG